MPTKRVGDLEVNQDLAYQRREWLADRVGWAVMSLVILAGLLGLFGHGWLSWAEATDHSGAVKLRYERFLHYDEPTELVLTVPADMVREGRFRVWLNKEYLAQIHIHAITPTPRKQELGGDRQWFVFEATASAGADEESGNAGHPLEIVFRVATVVRGSLSGRLGVDNGPAADGPGDSAKSAVTFGQFVYP
jgi:hypothetical protein